MKNGQSAAKSLNNNILYEKGSTTIPQGSTGEIWEKAATLLIKIYTLAHPITGEIRYVGKTKYSLNDRLCKHMITYEKNHRANWIRSIEKLGLKPIIELLEEVSEDNWIEAEQYWITQFKAWGFRLLNATEGGESGIISKQCRIAHKEKMTGRKVKITDRIKKAIERKQKPVLQFNKNGLFIQEFFSVSEASIKTKTQLSHITECCNNKPKRKSANKFIWKYKVKI